MKQIREKKNPSPNDIFWWHFASILCFHGKNDGIHKDHLSKQREEKPYDIPLYWLVHDAIL